MSDDKITRLDPNLRMKVPTAKINEFIDLVNSFDHVDMDSYWVIDQLEKQAEELKRAERNKKVISNFNLTKKQEDNNVKYTKKTKKPFLTDKKTGITYIEQGISYHRSASLFGKS
jgi:hypothetical protein